MATTNGTLIGTEQQLGGTGVNIPTRAGVVEHTLPFTTVLPTDAQLTSGNFNYRLRVRCSNASTYELYSIKAPVTHEVAAQIDVKLVEERDCELLLYLPPYSPDFNPIE